LTFFAVRAQANDVVDRIAIDTLSQIFPPFRVQSALEVYHVRVYGRMEPASRWNQKEISPFRNIGNDTPKDNVKSAIVLET
jgi:hypothetical protein